MQYIALAKIKLMLARYAIFREEGGVFVVREMNVGVEPIARSLRITSKSSTSISLSTREQSC
jgi:hypothetical protein